MLSVHMCLYRHVPVFAACQGRVAAQAVTDSFPVTFCASSSAPSACGFNSFCGSRATNPWRHSAVQGFTATHVVKGI
jgi:hypothetical protein